MTTWALMVLVGLLIQDEPGRARPSATPPVVVVNVEDLPRPGTPATHRPATVQLEGLDPDGMERAVYEVDTAARSTVVFTLPPGPRTLRSWVLEPEPGTEAAWNAARVRVGWETEDTDLSSPAIALLMGSFLPDKPGGEAKDQGLAAPRTLRFPMPYRGPALLRIDTDAPLRGRVIVRSTPGRADASYYFRGGSWPIGGDAARPAEVHGPGHVVALLLMDHGSASARFSVMADGRAWLNVKQGPVAVDERGGGERSRLYLPFVGDPAPFSKTLSIAAEATGASGAGGHVVVFWYAKEPAPRPPAPGEPARPKS